MLIENVDQTTSEQTVFLLNALAKRLSGREDCKKVQYIVQINHNGVSMQPMLYVFPNRYHRKESDKMEVISYIHQYKMNNALLSGFVFGTYQYQLSVDGKRRKWVKIS